LQASNIATTVRTIIIGLVYLATFIFSANALGLTGDALQWMTQLLLCAVLLCCAVLCCVVLCCTEHLAASAAEVLRYAVLYNCCCCGSATSPDSMQGAAYWLDIYGHLELCR
jgi:Na+/H+-dicarboxylate symporter